MSSVTVRPALSAQYEPVVRHALYQRRTRLLSLSFVVTHILVWSAMPSNLFTDGIAACLVDLLRPATFALSSLTWLLGVLPSIAGRGYFETRRAAEPTVNTFTRHALSRPQTAQKILFMLVAGLTWAFVAAYANDLSLFAPTKRQPHALNERIIVLTTSLACAGACFALYEVLAQRNVVTWARKEQKSPAAAIATHFSKRTFTTIAAAAVLGPALIIFTYMTFKRSVVKTLLLTPGLGMSLRPFLAPLLRVRATSALDGSLYRLTCVTMFRALFAWQVAGGIRAGYQGFPVSVTPLVSDPIAAIVQGVKSSSSYFEFTAWHELARVVPDARRSLFASQAQWQSVVRDGLLRLGRDYQLLLRRGAPAPAPPPPPAASPLSFTPAWSAQLSHSLSGAINGSGPARIHEATLLRPGAAIYKPGSSFTPATLFANGLASDGVLTQALSGVPDLFIGMGVAAKDVVGDLRDMLGGDKSKPLVSVPSVIPAAKASIEKLAQPVTEPFIALPAPLKTLWAQVTWLHSMWTAPRTGAAAEKALPDAAVDVVVIDALTRLIAASLEEDAIGSVQRDIPRALEALCALLDGVEEAEREGLSGPVTEVGDALRKGLKLVCKTFGGRMRAFRVPTRTARKLQAFMDYTA